MENRKTVPKGGQAPGLTRNRWTFGLGTVGRDMVYTLVSMYLTFYLTDVLQLPTGTLWWITGIVLACRVFDALNDPVMGLVVDNTRTRWGKFKPWIAFGAAASGILTVLMYTDFHLSGAAYVVSFGVIYLLWGIAFTTNDISFWSMLPTLSVDQKERERIGSIARICANVGLFFVVAGIVPLTTALGGALGGLQQGYTAFAAIVVAVMWAGQLITLFGVREPKTVVAAQQHTGLKELFSVIGKNDQLLYTALSMTLFMLGYMTTTSFGLYFFKYAYGDENMYSIFAVILGVSQIAALALFPLFSKRFNRRTIYTTAMVLVIAGYILFFFAPTDTMLFIGIAGMLIFLGQAAIQLLMLMFLADSVDYGHWKLHKRNDSITFSLQPFIYKLAGALGNGVVSVVIILSGIKDAQTAADVSAGGLLMMKVAMLLFPLVCVLLSYVIYRRKYRIDEKLYGQIVADLAARGEIELPEGEQSEPRGEDSPKSSAAPKPGDGEAIDGPEVEGERSEPRGEDSPKGSAAPKPGDSEAIDGPKKEEEP